MVKDEENEGRETREYPEESHEGKGGGGSFQHCEYSGTAMQSTQQSSSVERNLKNQEKGKKSAKH